MLAFVALVCLTTAGDESIRRRQNVWDIINDVYDTATSVYDAGNSVSDAYDDYKNGKGTILDRVGAGIDVLNAGNQLHDMCKKYYDPEKCDPSSVSVPSLSIPSWGSSSEASEESSSEGSGLSWGSSSLEGSSDESSEDARSAGSGEDAAGDEEDAFIVCQDVEGWTDSQDDGCDWYESDPARCLAYGHSQGTEYMAAVEACCVCGGGEVNLEDFYEDVMRAGSGVVDWVKSNSLYIGAACGALLLAYCLRRFCCRKPESAEQADSSNKNIDV